MVNISMIIKIFITKAIFIAMVENKECLDNLSELMQLDFVDAFS